LLVFLVIGNPKLPAHRRARQRQIDERLAQVIQRDEANPVLRPVFDHEVAPLRQPIATLTQQLGGLPVLDGNTVELLAQYDATIDRLVADIDQATMFVHLLMYIFADDATGQGVVCGVRVEEIEDPLMRKVRYLDKLIDELAKDKAVDKILRQSVVSL
jgi:cardiolipin synthase